MTLAILIHALIFLVFWLTNLSFQAAVNDFLVDTIGFQADFLLIFLIFAGLVGSWSALRLALRRNVRRTGPAWLYHALGIFFIVFFYGSFAVLFMKNPVQVARLGQLIQYFRILFDATILLLVAWAVCRYIRAGRIRRKILAAAGLLLLWLVPLFWLPGNVYRGALPDKPRLIAHRGASSLAPENTLVAMIAAVNLGVSGLETDINISRDGVLFLMHDSTLARTTDVAQVFPGRENDPAQDFGWAELTQLDAGSWFVGSAAYPGEPIPTLAEVLRLVEENELVFIYDLRIPSPGHPFAGETLDLCLQEIEAAGIAPRTWVLAGSEEIGRVRAILPAAILAAGVDYRDPPSTQSLHAAGYRVVNSEYGLSTRMIHAYREAGLWVNLWTVDEPWQYSRLWLAGADSVTSNNVQTFAAMRNPLWAIPFPLYLAVWVLIGILAIWECFSK